MKKLLFKSDIKCSGCLLKVTPVLNNISQIKKWSVDLNHPDRILTTEGDDIDENLLTEKIKEAGYHIKKQN